MVKQVSKINLKTLAALSIMDDEANKMQTSMPLGRIVGFVTGLVSRQNLSGEGTTDGLKGDFIASAPGKDDVRAFTFYPPADLRKAYADLYPKGAEDKHPKGPLAIAIELIGNRAKNGAVTATLRPIVAQAELPATDFMAVVQKQVADADKAKK